MTITVPVNTFRQVELVTLRTPPISGGVVRDTAKVLVSPLIDLFKGNAFKGEKNFLNWCKNIIVVSRLVGIVTVPYYLVKTAINAWQMRGASKEKKVNLALDIVEDIRNGGDKVTGFIGALNAIKVVTLNAARVITSMTGALALFSLGTAIKYARATVNTHRLLSDITKIEKRYSFKGEHTLNALREIGKLFAKKQEDNKNFFNNHFGTDQKEVEEALENRTFKIQEMLYSTDADVKKEGQKLLEKTLSNIKTRVKKNRISSALTALSEIISLIGTAIILAAAATPVGWAIYGLGLSLYMGTTAYSYFTDHKIKIQLGITKGFNIVGRITTFCHRFFKKKSVANQPSLLLN